MYCLLSINIHAYYKHDHFERKKNALKLDGKQKLFFKLALFVNQVNLGNLNDKRTFVNILQNALNTINSPTKKKTTSNWMKNNHFIYTFQIHKISEFGAFYRHLLNIK
jgi:hypothetical protein